MASQVVGTIPEKEATAPLVQTPFSGPAETGRSQASKTDTSYPDQSSAVAAPLGTIHSAKLVEQAAQSELRVGFHAGEFGNVDIRTSMIHSQLTAEISVEHGELRNLLAVELPHLQTKLAEHSFTAANIALSTHTGGGSSNSRQAYQQNGQGSQSVNARLAEHSTPGVTALEDSQVPMTQLDVHM
jgi:flagellar hook-length control protein FliK